MSKTPISTPKTDDKANNGSAAAPEAVVSPQAAAPGESNPKAQPTMRILGQYLKDLSFENPNAPQTLAPQQAQPDINISVNVNARNLTPTDFEVELHLDAKATLQEKVIFAGHD